MTGPRVKIVVTPEDRRWLRFAVAALLGGRHTTKLERRKAAQNLERLAYRADLAEEEGR